MHIKFLRQVIPVLIPISALILYSGYYFPFISDDSFISLRYAERLLNGEGLTWTTGEKVEGYSNLLWILLTSALSFLKLNLVDSCRVAGLLSTFTTMSLIYKFHLKFSAFVATCCTLIFGLSGTVAIWTIGGLEQPLYGLLLAGAIVTTLSYMEGYYKSHLLLYAGVALGLMALTRPDGFLFVVAFALTLLIRPIAFRVKIKEIVALSAIPIALVSLQIVFRYIYYQDLVPNTAHIKAEYSSQRLLEGIHYLKSGLISLSPLLIVVLPSIYSMFRNREERYKIALLMICLLVWSCYVALIGGDIFPGYRHLLPIVIIIVFLSGYGIQAILTLRSDNLKTRLLTFALLSLPIFFHFQISNAQNQRALDERWEFDGEVIGRLFGAGFKRQRPRIAVSAAGAIPYYSKLPTLDMLGLNDRYIAQQPAKPGYGLGHDHGDGEYVILRQPDLIQEFVYGGKLRFAYGKYLENSETFKALYQRVRFKGVTPHEVNTDTYVHITGRVGIRAEESSIVYPGYMLIGDVEGQLNDKGEMIGKIAANSIVSTRTLRFLRGSWSVTVDHIDATSELLLENIYGQSQLKSDSQIIDVSTNYAIAKLKILTKSEEMIDEIEITKLEK